MAIDKLVIAWVTDKVSDGHTTEEGKGVSRFILDPGLLVISVDISRRSAGIGTRSGMIFGSVSPGLDATSEPLR